MLNLSTSDNILYFIIIMILMIAIFIKYLCVYVYKCDKKYKY